MSKVNINTTQMPVVPALDPNRVLERSLQGQGLPVTTSALEYARQNAVAPIPENRYQDEAPSMAAYDAAPSINRATDPDSWEAPVAQERPAQRPYPDQGQDQLEMLNNKGMPLTIEQAQAAHEFERQRQMRKATGNNFEWQTREELSAAFPKTVANNPTHRDTIMNVADDLGGTLASIQAELGSDLPNSPGSFRMSAMQNLKQGLGLSAPQVASLSTSAFAMLAPVLSGASESVEGEIKDQAAAEMHAWGSDTTDSDVAPIALVAQAGGLAQDTIDGILGNTIMKLNKRSNVDAKGNALVPRATNIPARVAGATVRQGLVDSGLLIEDVVKGQKVYRLSPIQGMNFYKSARGLANDLTDMGRGRSQTVPVTTTGQLAGAQRNARGGDKEKTGYESVPVVAEAKRIAGSVGMVVNPIKAFFNALFTNQALNEVYGQGAEGKAPGGSPAGSIGKPIDGMSSTAKLLGFSNDDSPEAKKAKATGMIKLANYYGQNIIENAPRYSKFWEDYSVHRIYNDSEDANVQRDKQSRAVYNGNSTPVGISGTKYHQQGISKMEASKHLTAIRGQVERGNMKLTDQQREVAWLATLGKVLDVGSTIGRDTDSLTLADQIALVTPEFIYKAAAIGETLASIVPMSESAIASASLDMKQLSTELTPEQLGALNNFIGSSKKKDWGYRLQGYLDAANYLNAKEKGIAFTPQATVEIDMNSAGRVFLAMDGGNIDVLQRTGVLWEKVTDNLIDNTQPMGGPRFHFVEMAAGAGVDKAISQDQPERLAAWKSVLGQVKNKEMADAFAKAVLLTTDYGKPASYHMDDARKFFAKFPDIRDQLLPYYEGGLKEMVVDLNAIYGSTIKEVVSQWQMRLPKDVVALLQMANRLPKAKGYWGEQLSVGSFMAKPTGEYTTLRSASGDTQKIEHTRQMLDPMAAAKPKLVHDAEGNPVLDDEGNVKPFVPGPGSSAMNQIGPVMGQYRESVLVAEVMNLLNGGKAPKDMLFMQPVFDNLMLNSDSYIQTVHAANNIILPKVLSWNMQQEFINDLSKQIKEIDHEIRAKKEVDIGTSGEYPGMFLTLDRELGYINKSIAEGKWVSDAQKKFKAAVEREGSGYVQPGEDRPVSHFVKADQAINLIKAMYAYKMYDHARKESLLDRWANAGKSERNRLMAKVNDMAKRGQLYFMN